MFERRGPRGIVVHNARSQFRACFALADELKSFRLSVLEIFGWETVKLEQSVERNTRGKSARAGGVGSGYQRGWRSQ